LHSKKPNKFRNLIAQWYPDKNKLELFARIRTEGWDVFGNEVKCDVEIETPDNSIVHSFDGF